MGQVAPTIEPELQILFHRMGAESCAFKKICLSQLNREAFCLISDGLTILNERIVDFNTFEAALKYALFQLKEANQNPAERHPCQFPIGGLGSPVEATIEDFCDSESPFDFTMTFISKDGEPVRWISMGESVLERLLKSF